MNNVALDKEVSSSSIPPWIANTTLQASVDGITNTSTWTELFQTNFEHHPWITIDLGGLAVIKNVVLYNRKDDHGNVCCVCTLILITDYSITQSKYRSRGGCNRSIRGYTWSCFWDVKRPVFVQRIVLYSL